MNRTNVQHAINIMQRVIDNKREFKMSAWQEPRYGIFGVRRWPAQDEETLHKCGTAACFAGWVAVSPEFQKDGGKVGVVGEPEIDRYQYDRAIAAWLDIPHETAAALCFIGHGYFLYKGPLEHITPQMVIEKLQMLLDGKDIFEEVDNV